MGSIGSKKLWRWWVAAALLGGGCFSPRVPDGTIVCNRDSDCPAGLICTPGTDGTAALCCRGGTCPARVRGAPGALPPADGGLPGPALDAGSDAAASPPPAGDAASDAPGPESGGGYAPITCTASVRAAPAAGQGKKLHCVILAGDEGTSLGLELITSDDPVSTVTHGGCQAALSLAPGADAGGATARPLPAATVDTLVATLRQLRQVCSEAGTVPVGAVATGWARRASNRAEIQARVRAEAQLELEVPDEARELEHRYRGAARNRRGRIVLDEGPGAPELLVWPRAAAAPTRHPLPLPATAVAAMYLAPGTYGSFEQARLALRTRLFTADRALWAGLAEQVGGGAVESEVAVGPTTDATVPLAVGGMLRNAMGGWLAPLPYQARLRVVERSVSPYGQALGILTPAQVDGFFTSITAADFTQLRSEPIRDAYGARVVLATVLLDLLGDEALATEFGFTATPPYLGFLLSKLFPNLE